MQTQLVQQTRKEGNLAGLPACAIRRLETHFLPSLREEVLRLVVGIALVPEDLGDFPDVGLTVVIGLVGHERGKR